MHFIDLVIFAVYILAMLAVGLYYFRNNKSSEDYYVGGRGMTKWHIGLSVVATDVGGGFSIGLGGLGFAMGLSGSWMLFTGLIGAWLTAVVLVPRVYRLASEKKFFTFPQIFEHFYDRKVALLAGLISVIGYLGFTSSQILAGAKLASATFDGLSIDTAIVVMGIVAVVYTVMGGLKAVIYTDTVQWILLMGGLIFIGIPMAYLAVGGWDAIKSTLDPAFLSMTNVGWKTLFNWAITIIPIWFVGMTLYQRIYACKSETEAKKAWFIAGVFEFPIMAFMGVLLGLFARVGFENEVFAWANASQIDSEMGLPLLLKSVLPIGLTGLMMSAYFSAILSTADSCLMAASGNFVTDLLGKVVRLSERAELRFSQITTLFIGAAAVTIALAMENVLELMLLSYAFMVSGLLVPVLMAWYTKKPNFNGAFAAMLAGGTLTAGLELIKKFGPNSAPGSALNDIYIYLNEKIFSIGLDANLYGIAISLILYVLIAKLSNKQQHEPTYG